MLWIAVRPQCCPDAIRTDLTRLALSLTSQCAWHDNSTLLMDVSASLHLFGGIRRLRQHLRNLLEGLMADHAQAAVCVSISAMGAWLLAQPDPARWYYALSHKRLIQQSNRLPVALLDVCKPFMTWFEGIGCKTLAQLRALPRAQLQARTHRRVLAVLDQIEARALWAYQTCQLPECFVQRRSLDEPVYRVELLEALLQPMLQQMCQWLQDRQRALGAWEVRLFHASRRRAQAPSRLRIALAEPGWRIEHLAHLLEVKLQSWQLPAPVTDLMLLSDTVVVRQAHNQTLFADTQSVQQTLRQTLDTLRIRLGDTAILQAVPRHDHRPEQANQWQPNLSSHPSEASADVGGEPHSPAWLLPEPRRIETDADRPFLGEPLRLLHGPYRIETGWWDHVPAQRDYFVATDSQARHYWIYRERDQHNPCWYLHGLFG